MSNLEKFRELGISERVLKALAKKGFEEPSPIQIQTIPLLLKGEKDVIGQAQTGTGKTAAFGIPILEKIQEHSKDVQAIILAPTRELAIQVAEEINSLKGASPLEVMAIYGGQAIDIQLRRLYRGVDIVVGTPGRVIDLINRRALVLDSVTFAVLDEADEMLNMGFIEDIEEILSNTPKEKQMLMFSATMPQPIMRIAEKFMNEYEIVRVKKQQLTTNLTEQIYFEVRRVDKFEVLCRIIDMESDFFGLVFCRTRNDVDEVVEMLANRGYNAEALHGDISQPQRLKVIDKIKRKVSNLLIATDVAARGIDINNLTHVINFSIPQDPEAYIHRIGRTGRAGNKGTAITFVTPAEYRKLTHIKKVVKTDIKKQPLPDAASIVESKKNKLMEAVTALVEEDNRDYIDLARELLEEQDAVSVLSALLKHTLKEELLAESYTDIGGRGRRNDGGGVDDQGTARLFVALGKKDGMNPKRLVDLIWDKARVKSRLIQGVKCFDTFSFITVPFNSAEIIIDAFQKDGRGNKSLVEMASDKDKKGGEGGGDRSGGGGKFKRGRKKFSKKKSY
jgi:ATP-dependent RNA helicase DeaD